MRNNPNLSVAHWPQKYTHWNNEAFSIALMSHKDILTVPWLDFFEQGNNTALIFENMMDALHNKEILSTYFWELADESVIQKRFAELEWNKQPFSQELHDSKFNTLREQLFFNNHDNFVASVERTIAALQKQIEAIHKRARKKWKAEVHDDHEVLNETISEIKRTIKKIQWQLENINHHENKEFFEKKNAEIVQYQEKLKPLEAKRATYRWVTQYSDEETQQLETMEAKKELLVWAITSPKEFSETYNQLKEEYQARVFDTKAKQRVDEQFYSEPQSQFNQWFADWFSTMQDRYSMKKDPEHFKETKNYQKQLRATKNMFTSKIDINDHFLTATLELVQIQLLEDIVKMKYPQYDISVVKAPLMDDITADTDCFIIVRWDDLKNDVYIAIDLKTSENPEYLKAEREALKNPSQLEGASSYLGIDPAQITNNLIAFSPALTYNALTWVLTDIKEWKQPKQNLRWYLDKDIFLQLDEKFKAELLEKPKKKWAAERELAKDARSVIDKAIRQSNAA